MANKGGLRDADPDAALIDIRRPPVASVFTRLLADKGRDRPIVWATDSYAAHGEGFADRDAINGDRLLRHADILRPRVQKSQAAQAVRTRKKAEVTTSAGLCNRMNNVCDEDWFGRRDVFNVPRGDGTWEVVDAPIAFPNGRTWRQYVDSRRLEITCGEAPYLASRYDATTGARIPLERRIGVLDRKLRIVSENAAGYDEWATWAIRAVEATYGYEYQGDSLLIARINLLLTFVDWHTARWRKPPAAPLLRKAANRIAWNVWQMDGLTDEPPFAKPREVNAPVQLELFGDCGDVAAAAQDKIADTTTTPNGITPAAQDKIADAAAAPNGMTPAEQDKIADTEAHSFLPSRIFDWRARKPIVYKTLKEVSAMKGKLFDYVIGNPPYNEDFENSGENGNFAKPVYHRFMSESYKVADKVELVHPARFLFNAGSTPKPWNESMLNDPHFKVLRYEANSTALFPDVDIKGGVAVTYRDATKDYGAIGTFTAFHELNGIVRKGRAKDEVYSLASLVHTQVRYDLQMLYSDMPQLKKVIGSDGKDKRFRNNTFEKVPVFSQTADDNTDIKVLGILKNKRTWRYIARKYVDMEHGNLKRWKVLVPRANGSGALGEVLCTPLIGEPLIGEPLIGYTQSFIGIGAFDSENEANALMRYVKTKFARALLGVLKVTQDNDRGVWTLIPLQDFTAKSDIDWSKSVRDIDRQLYCKYGLDEKEIAFIESHVKEMA